MPSQGPYTPASVVDDGSFGSVPWSSADLATVADGSGAAALLNNGETTHALVATEFGFAIPSGAIVRGIVVAWRASGGSAPGDVIDAAARIVRDGVIGSAERAGRNWPDALDWLVYGDPSDSWGASWTAEQINAAGFGAALAAAARTDGVNLRVDAGRITVYYDTSAGAPRAAQLLRQLRS